VAEAPTRILVALDARPESLRSLERTVALAAELGAEIAALFIEDEELMRLCDLPVVEVTLRGGTVRRPEAATLRREVRARASAARKALERAAVTRRVAWSFQITRGRIREEVERGSPGTDVVTLRRSTRWRRSTGRAAPVVGAVLEGDDRRPLALAARLAQASGAPLLVLVPEPDLADPDGARARIESAIGADTPATVAGYRPGPEGLAHRLAGLDLDVLVLHAPAITPEALDRLCGAAGCELIVLGGATGADSPPQPQQD
jgi:hypothetical protein